MPEEHSIETPRHKWILTLVRNLVLLAVFSEMLLGLGIPFLVAGIIGWFRLLLRLIHSISKRFRVSNKAPLRTILVPCLVWTAAFCLIWVDMTTTKSRAELIIEAS